MLCFHLLMVTDVNKKKTFVNICVKVTAYVIDVGACRVQKAWKSLKLEVQALVSHRNR